MLNYVNITWVTHKKKNKNKNWKHFIIKAHWTIFLDVLKFETWIIIRLIICIIKYCVDVLFSVIHDMGHSSLNINVYINNNKVFKNGNKILVLQLLK